VVAFGPAVRQLDWCTLLCLPQNHLRLYSGDCF